ncbi:hypothetical protein BGW38_008405, partial [Lunasporangiospora selenospora]
FGALVIDDTHARSRNDILHDIETTNKEFFAVRKELSSLYHWYDDQKEQWDKEEASHPALVIRKSEKFLARCLRLDHHQLRLINQLIWLEQEFSHNSKKKCSTCNLSKPTQIREVFIDMEVARSSYDVFRLQNGMIVFSPRSS